MAPGDLNLVMFSFGCKSLCGVMAAIFVIFGNDWCPKWLKNMFKLKIDINIVVFGFSCKSILHSEHCSLFSDFG